MKIFKKEKHVRSLIKDHLNLTTECVQVGRRSLENFLAGSFETAAESSAEVNRLESQADQLKREVRSMLFEGAFLPQIRADIYHVVSAVDSVAGKVESMCRFLANQTPSVPDEYHAQFIEIYAVSEQSFSELRQMLRQFLKPKSDRDEMLEHVNRVSELESQTDQKEEFLTRAFFSSSLDLAEKQHLKKLAEKIGDIADKAEVAADELEFAILKSVV